MIWLKMVPLLNEKMVLDFIIRLVNSYFIIFCTSLDWNKGYILFCARGQKDTTSKIIFLSGYSNIFLDLGFLIYISIFYFIIIIIIIVVVFHRQLKRLECWWSKHKVQVNPMKIFLNKIPRCNKNILKMMEEKVATMIETT